MTRSAGRRRLCGSGATVIVATLVLLSGCGGGTTTPSSTASSGPPGADVGDGRVPAGSQAFPIDAGCTRAVADGKDLLAIACSGAVSKLDPVTGKATWSVRDPKWSEFVALELGADVVVGSVRVVIPASGVTAKQEGNQVVAVHDGKKVWESRLFPPSPQPRVLFATTADVTVLALGGGANDTAAPSVAAIDTRSGRQRWEKTLDKGKCPSASQPLIFKDSVAACGLRFALADGAPLPIQPLSTVLRSEPVSDVAAVRLDNNETTFSLVTSEGKPTATVKGEFLGFAGATIIVRRTDSSGKTGSVAGVAPDGAVRWEQTITFDTARGYFENLSFANGSVWVRNGSNELTAIDGATGKLTSPIRAESAGLAKTAQVLATTTRAIVLKTGDGDRHSSLLAVAK